MMYAKSLIGSGISQTRGYIIFQFQRMYNRHRIAAEERMYGLLLRINTKESILIL